MLITLPVYIVEAEWVHEIFGKQTSKMLVGQNQLVTYLSILNDNGIIRRVVVREQNEDDWRLSKITTASTES